jgi:hypothetical protein
MRTPLEQRIYNTHRYIKQTIYNPNNETYQIFVKNGIPLEEDVGSFADFYKWVVTRLGPPPFPDARILRKDQGQGYIRKNLEWGSHQQQGNRLLRAHKIKFRGRTQCLKQWAQELNLCKDTVYKRYYRGVTTPRELFKATR